MNFYVTCRLNYYSQAQQYSTDQIKVRVQFLTTSMQALLVYTSVAPNPRPLSPAREITERQVCTTSILQIIEHPTNPARLQPNTYSSLVSNVKKKSKKIKRISGIGYRVWRTVAIGPKRLTPKKNKIIINHMFEYSSLEELKSPSLQRPLH